jgi:hypothetical protein
MVWNGGGQHIRGLQCAGSPTVGECMELATGVKFSKNNGDAQVNVEA